MRNKVIYLLLSNKFVTFVGVIKNRIYESQDINCPR